MWWLVAFLCMVFGLAFPPLLFVAALIFGIIGWAGVFGFLSDLERR